MPFQRRQRQLITKQIAVNKPVIVHPDCLDEYDAIASQVSRCTLCRLGRDGRVRNRAMFRGNLPADVAFVGGAPSHDDNLSGLPFSGPAGNLLDRIIYDSFSEYRHAKHPIPLVAFFNVVNCYPFSPECDEGRPLVKEEWSTCTTYHLVRLLKLCRPSLIVAVGEVAHNALLRIPSGAGILNLNRLVKIRAPGWIAGVKSGKNGTSQELEEARATQTLREAYGKAGILF